MSKIRLTCNNCGEEYTDVTDTTSMCSTCGGRSFRLTVLADQMKDCISALKVGDSVVVKLLPYNARYKTIEESITFPVIGFDRKNVPMIGTRSIDLYNNHHFISTNAFYPEMQKWTYCMSLNVEDIEIERIIKGPPPPRWRTGTKLGRTLYLDNHCVGMVDTPEIANLIVAAMNK